MLTIGKLIEAITGKEFDRLVMPITDVVIDSRQVKPGALFIALPGEKVDGHDFVNHAFEAGAIAALVDKDLDHAAEVIDLRTLKPLDKDMILDSLEKTGRVVIVHEAPRTLGYGAELSAIITERCILRLKAPVLRVAGYDVTPPLARLENYYLPDPLRVIMAIHKVMTF